MNAGTCTQLHRVTAATTPTSRVRDHQSLAISLTFHSPYLLVDAAMVPLIQTTKFLVASMLPME